MKATLNTKNEVRHLPDLDISPVEYSLESSMFHCGRINSPHLQTHLAAVVAIVVAVVIEGGFPLH